MGILFAIFLVIVGALAAYPRVVQTWPNGKALIDKLLPYQGAIGIVSLIWGVAEMVRRLARMGVEVRLEPAVWLVMLAGGVVAVLLGILLGYGVIAQHVLGRSPEMQRRGDEIRARLIPRQVQLGMAGMALGLLGFLLYLAR
jgi:hypothetical protein